MSDEYRAFRRLSELTCNGYSACTDEIAVVVASAGLFAVSVNGYCDTHFLELAVSGWVEGAFDGSEEAT